MTSGVKLTGREALAHLDNQITHLYQQKTERGAVKAFCQRHGVPRHRVRLRALALGVAQSMRKEPPWSQEEIDLLEMHYFRTAPSVSALFRRHGFSRTAGAVANKRKRLQFRLEDSEVYTARRLASVMGVNAKVITRWIEKGWLRARRKGTDRKKVQGRDMYQIPRYEIARFIRDNVAMVDICKTDKFWLVDLLAGMHAAITRLRDHTCCECYVEFQAHGNVKFCSKSCQNRHAYKRTRAKMQQEINKCHVCSVEFAGHRNRKYCSKGCLALAQSARRTNQTTTPAQRAAHNGLFR